MQSATNVRYKPTPDLLILCFVRSQGECCNISVNFLAAVPQENRSLTRDIDRALHMGRSLLCSTVSVNGFSEGDIKILFAGHMMSGLLARLCRILCLTRFVGPLEIDLRT